MIDPISDFTPAELDQVEALLVRRFGHATDLQPAEAELALDPGSDRTTFCPTLYWTGNGAQFVVFKVGADRYRCQFYYGDTEHFGTGRDEYRDIEDCVLTLLRVQSDHQRERAGIPSGASAADLGAAADADYSGPALL